MVNVCFCSVFPDIGKDVLREIMTHICHVDIIAGNIINQFIVLFKNELKSIPIALRNLL